jgi:solute carrier family 15 oligopeptide transporter 1
MDNPTMQSSNEDLNEKEPVFTKEIKNYTSLTNSEMTKFNSEECGKEADEKKEPFPKHVFLIILSEFCERFSYYGLRTILILYFTQFIKISENDATAYFHAFTMICYFTPILGAILSDGYIGQFKTILYISIVYCIGDLILSLTAIKALGAPNLAGPLIGLLIIGFGTGGIKPCVSAFGGDQFKEGQKKFLDTFFSIFYLSINIGSLLGTILTPILRSDVKCFNDNCYPLAFGVPTILMFISIVVFVVGKPLYYFKEVDRRENLFKKLFKCIVYAIRMRIKNRKVGNKKEHWLDYAQDKYDSQFISDVKAFCKVIFMFLPVPVFWALFDQQGNLYNIEN